jgi:hypothetical protein
MSSRKQEGTKGELRRLAAPESDWNFPAGVVGRRTRGPKDVPETIDVAECTVTTSEESQLTGATEGSNAAESPCSPVMVFTKKPTHSRVLLEVSQLEQAFANRPCPECSETLELHLRTVCIATNIELICNNKDCTYQSLFDRPSPTMMHVNDKYNQYERMTDYAANVLFVLGLISVGDGATEAGRLIGLMGLPNDTTMMNRSFGIIEERVG